MNPNVISKNNIYERLPEGALLTAGTPECFNTMTIGWGTSGVIWGRKVFIVYVRPSRYTYRFIEKNPLFTVSFYDRKYQKEINYIGTYSGRDTDKIKDVGFTPLSIGGGVTFEEAETTVLCKTIYSQDLDGSRIPPEILNHYYQSGSKDEFHRFYIGEIIDIKKG